MKAVFGFCAMALVVVGSGCASFPEYGKTTRQDVEQRMRRAPDYDTVLDDGQVQISYVEQGNVFRRTVHDTELWYKFDPTNGLVTAYGRRIYHE